MHPIVEVISSIITLIMHCYIYIAVGVALFIGIYCKIRLKKSFWESYHLASGIFVIFLTVLLLFLFLYSENVPQDLINKFTIVSLLIAILALSSSNIKDLKQENTFSQIESEINSINEKNASLDSNIKNIINTIEKIETFQKDQFEKIHTQNFQNKMNLLNRLEEIEMSQKIILKEVQTKNEDSFSIRSTLNKNNDLNK